MRCNVCGKEMDEGSRFCMICGADQQAQQSAYEQSAPVYTAPKTTSSNAGKVSFGKAIELYFKNYVNFQGRASVSEYWWACLFACLVNYGVSLLVPVPAVAIVVSLALCIPSLSLTVRRLHDTGKRWTYILMGLIPIAGSIILIIQHCKPSEGDNQWGPGPV